jgi:hypothetical protein
VDCADHNRKGLLSQNRLSVKTLVRCREIHQHIARYRTSCQGNSRTMFSEERAISLLLKMCRSNQGSLAINIQVWNSVRPMHLFGQNLDHDY